MNWLTNKKVTKMLSVDLFLVTVTEVCCLIQENVELFTHKCFHRELTNFDHVRKKAEGEIF